MCQTFELNITKYVFCHVYGCNLKNEKWKIRADNSRYSNFIKESVVTFERAIFLKLYHVQFPFYYTK